MIFSFGVALFILSIQIAMDFKIKKIKSRKYEARTFKDVHLKKIN